MKRLFYYICSFLIISLIFSCGTIPSETENSGNGSINILVWVNKLENEDIKTRETTWDKLVTCISAPDMADMLDTFDMVTDQSFYSFTINDVPAGDDRLVEAWTINSDDEDEVIHGVDSQTVSVEPDEVSQVVLELHPIKGSIYIVLTEIPTVIDSVVFAFVTNDITWEEKSKRASKLDMNLDKIPFDTTGTLSIDGYTIAGDTIASWKMENFTFTNNNTSINASFISVGKIGLQVTIYIPGVTIIYGIMDTTSKIGDEEGGLIITEIMYSANDSEYVEIYNPTEVAYDDTIILQKDNGTFRYFEAYIEPKGFFVIGRISLPWATTFHPTASALDLYSTSNWLTLRAKDTTLMDLAVFQGGSNEQEWPNFSTSLRASIVLDSLADDPEYNNFGRNWKQAQSSIDVAVTQQLGTPGKPGL